MARISRAFRIALAWQLLVGVAVAVLAGGLAGGAAGWSALLGGGIGVAGVWVFALVARRDERAPGRALRVVLRAEAVKLVVVTLLLWLAFVGYREMVAVAFFGAFMISVLLSVIAFAVPDD